MPNKQDFYVTLDGIACIRYFCHWLEIPEWFESSCNYRQAFFAHGQPLMVAAVVMAGQHLAADFAIGDVVDLAMELVEHVPVDSAAANRVVAVAHTLYSSCCF